MSRPVRVLLTLVVTALGTAYLVWKVDLSQTLDILAEADPWYFLAAVALMIVTVWPMALRWQWLLRAKGIDDSMSWLTRAYFVSYAAGQILPTSIGGDAVRIFETARRHPGKGGPAAASVLLERALGGAATLALAAVGFALAVGKYDVGAYLWLELFFVIGTVIAGVLIFSPRAGRILAKGRPPPPVQARPPRRRAVVGLALVPAQRRPAHRRLRPHARPAGVSRARNLVLGQGGRHRGLSAGVLRDGAAALRGHARPFTINGLAVREAFFVSFLGNVGVGADEAFAAGFLFFLVTIALSIPARSCSGRGCVGRGFART